MGHQRVNPHCTKSLSLAHTTMIIQIYFQTVHLLKKTYHSREKLKVTHSVKAADQTFDQSLFNVLSYSLVIIVL